MNIKRLIIPKSILGIVLLLSWRSGLAKDSAELDFNQGKDVERTVKSLGKRWPRLLFLQKIPLLKSPAKFSLQAPGFDGSVAQPLPTSFVQIIQSDRYYQQAVDVRGDSRYPGLAPHVLKPLNIQFNEIKSIREDLLTSAQDLDARKADFDEELAKLNEAREGLEARQEKIQREIAGFNEACPDGEFLSPDQYRACEARGNAIDIKATALRADVERYNARVDDYSERLSEATAVVEAWGNKGKNWDYKIIDFIRRVQAAFARADTGDCEKKQHRDLQNKVDQFCDVLRRCDPESLTCDELKARLDLNQKCAAARDEINLTCYSTEPDPTHRDKADEARKTAKKCQGRIARECGAGAGVMEEPE